MPAKLSTISGAQPTATPSVEELSLDENDYAEYPADDVDNTFDIGTITARPATPARTYDEVVAILASPLDMSVTKQREGFNKKMLNYLDGKYVIQTLNRIFGYGNWGYYTTTITDMALDPEVQIPMAVSANLTLWVQFPGADGPRAEFSDTGFGENVKPSYWDAEKKMRVFKDRTWMGYEMARKGAVTDALKRAAANLGDQFGLSLKGTDGDGVASGETPRHTTAPATTSSDAVASEGSNYACERCGKELTGYTAKASGKVYTAADMAKFSIRDTGKVLCFEHKKEHLDNHR